MKTLRDDIEEFSKPAYSILGGIFDIIVSIIVYGAIIFLCIFGILIILSLFVMGYENYGIFGIFMASMLFLPAIIPILIGKWIRRIKEKNHISGKLSKKREKIFKKKLDDYHKF